MKCIRFDCDNSGTMTLNISGPSGKIRIHHCDEHLGSAYRNFSYKHWSERGITITGITILEDE